MTETTVGAMGAAAEAFSEQTRQRAKAIVARYPQPRSALLPLLHLVQAEEGYVSARGVAFCAEVLGITKAQVGAVATFYTMYKRRPAGDWL
ncbi:MAG: NAD(P)H-dependent oxidoreductase subunit E, partial [Micromonosporaceae bacterium]